MKLDHAGSHGLAIKVVYLLQIFFDNKRWVRQHVEDDRCFLVSLVGFDPEIARR